MSLPSILAIVMSIAAFAVPIAMHFMSPALLTTTVTVVSAIATLSANLLHLLQPAQFGPKALVKAATNAVQVLFFCACAAVIFTYDEGCHTPTPQTVLDVGQISVQDAACIWGEYELGNRDPVSIGGKCHLVQSVIAMIPDLFASRDQGHLLALAAKGTVDAGPGK